MTHHHQLSRGWPSHLKDGTLSLCYIVGQRRYIYIYKITAPTSEPPGNEVKTDGIYVKVLSLVTADMLWPQKRKKFEGKKIFY